MKIKVIILEDDLIIAENLKENLIDLNYNVVAVVSKTKEFEEYYNAYKPDICIADIFLKGNDLNGVEIMKLYNVGDEIPIIYLSAYDDEEIRNIAKQTNPAAYLLKPTSKKQLDVAIDLAINNFQKKQLILDSGISSESENEEFFFLKTKEMFEKVKESQISYLHADGAYTDVITWTKKYNVSVNLKNFLLQYKGNNIVRCQKSYAVNMNYIKGFDDQYLFVIKGNSICKVPYNFEFKRDYLSNFPRIKSS